MDWRTKRRIIIGCIIFCVVFVIVSIPTYLIFFTGQPTCFDGLQNGSERGVDCGGGCTIACNKDVIDPVVVSAESFKVTDNVFNTVAVIENKNIDVGARDVAYTLSIIDENGRIIDSDKGVFDLPKQSQVALFAGSMRTSNNPISVTTKVQIDDVVWVTDAPTKKNIFVSLNAVENEDDAPRVKGTVVNNELQQVRKLQVVAVVSDDEGNPIGVSSTVTDSLSPDAEREIFFAWPEPFYVGSRVCDAQSGKKVSTSLGDVALVIDRSGSMDDESLVPPEPLNTVRLAAINFVRSMGQKDKASLISFANDATVDSGLTNDVESLIQKIDKISILTDSIQNTNLADGMLKAFNVLLSPESTNERKAMIVLTDGVATRPLDSSDANYPENYASDIAQGALANGVEMYVIGLGPDVNKEFLVDIAGDPSRYYGANKKEELATIYNQIATSICSKRPAIITTYVIEK